MCTGQKRCLKIQRVLREVPARREKKKRSCAEKEREEKEGKRHPGAGIMRASRFSVLVTASFTAYTRACKRYLISRITCLTSSFRSADNRGFEASFIAYQCRFSFPGATIFDSRGESNASSFEKVTVVFASYFGVCLKVLQNVDITSGVDWSVKGISKVLYNYLTCDLTLELEVVLDFNDSRYEFG